NTGTNIGSKSLMEIGNGNDQNSGNSGSNNCKGLPNGSSVRKLEYGGNNTYLKQNDCSSAGNNNINNVVSRFSVSGSVMLETLINNNINQNDHNGEGSESKNIESGNGANDDNNNADSVWCI
ncbi:2479_t:CDS:2, partial [Ambispora gerdemannii]